MRHVISVNDVLDSLVNRTVLIASSSGAAKVLEFRVLDRAYLVKDNKKIQTTTLNDVNEAVELYNSL